MERTVFEGTLGSPSQRSLSIFFISELAIKVIADGFAFTPNAYLLNIWNALDLFVLGTLVINVTTEIAVIGVLVASLVLSKPSVRCV